MTVVQNAQGFDTPGKRLKHVRSLLKMSRAYLQEKYGLPEVTLKSWENGTTNLTKSGAERCVEMYRSEGLAVSEDWILQGNGHEPIVTTDVSHYFATPSSKDFPIEDDEIAIIKDANVFKESYSSAVILIVPNDAMRPFYRPGDYVAGKMRFSSNIDDGLNKDCIVYLKNGERFFRRFIKNSTGGYNLTCLNPDENTAEPVLYNVEVEGVAPVIWHRWKDE